MLSIPDYCADPCRASSIPYWKAIQTVVPEGMRIVHDSVFDADLLEQYVDVPYFRLKHDLTRLVRSQLPKGFALRGASCREYAEHIGRCYSDIGISEIELHGYTQRRVYCPDLWIAVQDEATGGIAATGIAELDRSIGEGILEWIQVSPEYRRRGLGKFLVLELLNRLKPMAQFVTVSGQCHNPTFPEYLYRNCGFTGRDVWHILRRNVK